MKKSIMVAMILTLVLALCACGAEGKTSLELQENVGQTVGTEEATKPVTTEDTKQEETKQETPAANEFINESNNILQAGQIAVRPRHVYWDGNVLVAQCFVINGMDTAVSQLEVNKLQLSNGQGVIADAGFGSLDGVTLQPNEHVLWTFQFGADVVAMAGADLSSLTCSSSIGYVGGAAGQTGGRTACAICGGTGWQYNPSAYLDPATNMWMGQNVACSGCAGAGWIG